MGDQRGAAGEQPVHPAAERLPQIAQGEVHRRGLALAAPGPRRPIRRSSPARSRARTASTGTASAARRTAATMRSTEQCSGRSSRSGPVARSATFIASPIGSACTASGHARRQDRIEHQRAGGQHAGGDRDDAGAGGERAAGGFDRDLSAGPSQRTRVTGVFSRMSRPAVSRRCTNAPMPPSGTRLLPPKALRRQSSALNWSASTAQITGPSQASIGRCPGIVGKLARDLGQGDIALGRDDRIGRRLVSRPGTVVACQFSVGRQTGRR